MESPGSSPPAAYFAGSPVSPGPATIVDEVGLNSLDLKAELQRLEMDSAEAERRAYERMLQEQVFLKAGGDEKARDQQRFFEQSRFRWAVPLGPAESPVKGVVLPAALHARRRRRPVEVAAFVDIPQEPALLMNAAEQEEAWGDRAAALRLVSRSVAQRRRATEFDMETDLFKAAESSDDSDGYDEDVVAEWRRTTSSIYTVCRAVELGVTDERALTQFTNLLRKLAAGNARIVHEDEVLLEEVDDVDSVLSPASSKPKANVVLLGSERALLWDTLRCLHRHAEPLHPKRQLSAMHELSSHLSFRLSPSVAGYSQVMYAAMELSDLFPHRQLMKLRRWANRSTYLVRRRVAVLREMGVGQPTWADVNAGVSGMNRNVPVPQFTLEDTLALVTGNLADVTGGQDTDEDDVADPETQNAKRIALEAELREIAEEERAAQLAEFLAEPEDDRFGVESM